jgi:hypothetical protein
MRALKSLKYQTRRLMAGDDFEVKTPRKARILAAIGKAEVIPPRVAPPVAAVAPATHPGSDLESMTVGQLRGLAEERGIELPPGYVTRAALIGMLEGQPN